MLKKIFLPPALLSAFLLIFFISFNISAAADEATTPAANSFQPVADAPESPYFKRVDNSTSADGGAGTSYIQDTISNTQITDSEAMGDIKQAERDAQTVYSTAIKNGKGEDVAKQQSYNVLKAGSDLASAKQENNKIGALETLGNIVGYTGTTNERLAKLSEAEASYKKSLVSAYNETGDINKYGQSDYNSTSAAAFQDTANQARNGVFTVESSGKGDEIAAAFVPAAGGSYVLLAPIKTFFPTGSVDVKGAGLGGYLNGLYRAGIAVATGLALVMIVLGGLEYVSTDSIQGKSSGRERIKGAIVGLLLALGSFILLQQVNPNLLRSDLQVAPTSSVGGIAGSAVTLEGEAAPAYAGPAGGGPGGQVPAGGGSFSGATSVRQLLNSLPGGSRSSDGSLIFTNYWNGDTNTNQQRGNNCNLLVAGSVALSPDLISTYRPQKGAAVLVNSLLVGYYDDTTATSIPSGVAIRNTIDIYDPGRSYGSILKKMSPGSWNLTFGASRQQTPNPCK